MAAPKFTSKLTLRRRRECLKHTHTRTMLLVPLTSLSNKSTSKLEEKSWHNSSDCRLICIEQRTEISNTYHSWNWNRKAITVIGQLSFGTLGLSGKMGFTWIFNHFWFHNFKSCKDVTLILLCDFEPKINLCSALTKSFMGAPFIFTS